MKSLVSALAAVAAIGLQAATTYTATEQYVQNMVRAESNRADIAIGNLRQEVIDSKYLRPSSVKAGSNVTVTTNELGEVTISAGGGSADFTTNNTVLVNTIKTVAPAPADYATVSNKAMNALSNEAAKNGFTEWTILGLAEGEIITSMPHYEEGVNGWVMTTSRDNYVSAGSAANATNLVFSSVDVVPPLSLTATRVRLPTMADIPTGSTFMPEMDGYGGPGTSDRFAREDHIHPRDSSKADKREMVISVLDGDATKKNVQLKIGTDQDVVVEHQQLKPVYSQTWTFSGVSDGITDIQQPIFNSPPEGESTWSVIFVYNGETRGASIWSIDENATNLTFEYGDEGLDLHLTATRSSVGYTLGSQTDKVLASMNIVDYTEGNAVLTNTIAKVAPAPGDYAAVSNAAMNAAITNAMQDAAIAERPTKAQIEAGWWTEWTITPSGPYQWTVEYDAANGKWVATSTGSEFVYRIVSSDGENAVELTWGLVEDVQYTATRYRVSSPVPTQPSDIGALSRAEAEVGFTEWRIPDGIPYTLVRQPWISNGYWQVEYSFVGGHAEIMQSDEPASTTDTVVSMSGGIWSIERTRFPTMADLEGKASTNEVALTPVYGGNGERFIWTLTPTVSGSWEIKRRDDDDGWDLYINGIFKGTDLNSSIDVTELDFGEWVANRSENPIVGYVLGNQNNKVLAPTNSVELTAFYSRDTTPEWKITPSIGFDNDRLISVDYNEDAGMWKVTFEYYGQETSITLQGISDADRLSFEYDGGNYVLERGEYSPKGYVLGNQTQKIVAPAQALDNKIDKILNPTSGNLVEIGADGRLVDSGKKTTDFVVSADLLKVSIVGNTLVFSTNHVESASQAASQP